MTQSAQEVRSLWESLNAHVLSAARAASFLARTELASLAMFSLPALEESGKRVLLRDGELRLERWLEQVRYDVYEGAGRRGQADDEQLAWSARRLRASATPAEQHLWKALRRGLAGHRFECQVPMHGYILDFFCRAASLAVELDGSSHLLRSGEDRRRDEILLANRIFTLRYTNDQVFTERRVVLAEIAAQVRGRAPYRQPRQPSSPPKEREARSTPRRAPSGKRAARPGAAAGAAQPSVPSAPPAVRRRAFWCQRCRRVFVAPTTPAPACAAHPEEAVRQLCVSRDNRFAVIGDLCRRCAEARAVAASAAQGPDAFGQRQHRARKLF